MRYNTLRCSSLIKGQQAFASIRAEMAFVEAVPFRWIMQGIIDMHCHVLPGVDDGPATMADSIAVLREVVRQGVDTMVVTPHFHPGRYKVYASQVTDVLGQLREEAAREGLRIRLIPGQECYFYSGLMRELEAGRVLTMGGTSHVLVEFDPDVLYSVIQQAVRDVSYGGYRPIIAHYERYRCLEGRVDRLEELRGNGAMLQMNFSRLLARDTLFKRNPWRRQLKDGYVDFLGSDTHGLGFRPPHIDRAVEWMRREVDRDTRNTILKYNARLLTEPQE